MTTKTKLGKDLKVGDTVGVWWQGGRDTITKLVPYHGALSYLWDKYGGAQLASFARNQTGMTIEPQAMFEVY